MSRRRSAGAVAVGVMVLLGGCTDRTEGTPAPGAEPTSRAESTESTRLSSTSDEPDAEGTLADLEPCAVLTEAALAGLGLTGGEEKTVAGARVCRYRYEGATMDESFTVSVEMFDALGLADLNVQNQPLPDIGSHKAASFVDPAGGCGVSIGVTENSRVDNTAVGGDQERGCQLAASLAALVEPNLP